jgi:membrane protein YdbS with pleckstrin-like domain
VSQPADKLKQRADVRGESEISEPEEVLWTGCFSGLAMIGSWVLAGVVTLALVIGVWLSPWSDEGVAWYIVIGLLAALWIWLLGTLIYRKLSRYYELTTQRLKHRHGFLFRKMNRIELIDIDDVSYEQGPIEAMLGVGTIRLKSTDISHPELRLVGIADTKRVSELIDDARRKERRLRGLHIETV